MLCFFSENFTFAKKKTLLHTAETKSELMLFCPEKLHPIPSQFRPFERDLESEPFFARSLPVQQDSSGMCKGKLQPDF